MSYKVWTGTKKESMLNHDQCPNLRNSCQIPLVHNKVMRGKRKKEELLLSLGSVGGTM